MLLVFALLVEPGDEVVLGTPHYPCYPNFVRALRRHAGAGADATPRTATARPRRACAARSRRARARSWSARPRIRPARSRAAETLAALAALGLPLVSDEIYDGLVYDGARARLGARASASDAFVLDGFSKRYAMTGFRLG